MPTSVLSSLGLSILRFPSVPLHSFGEENTELVTACSAKQEVAAEETVETATSSAVLPFDLWGLTFRLTEDLLQHAAAPTKNQGEKREEEALLGAISATERPQVLFEDKRGGWLVNAWLRKHIVKY